MQDDGKLLSFLIPAYNVSEFIAECLSSITCQIENDTRFEILICDDASSDTTLKICQEHRAAHKGEIKIVRHESNKGVSVARNALMKAAAGEYIWFIDADDRLMPGAVASLLKVLTENEVDMVLCDYVREKGVAYATMTGATRHVERDTEQLLAAVFNNRRLHLWTKIFRRSIWDDSIRFPEGACFEDVAVVPRLLLRVKSYIHVPEAWIYYRSRPGSIMALVARAGRTFNRQLNEDLATALTGFGAELNAALPSRTRGTNMAVSIFLAREYAKIGKRYLRAKGAGITIGFRRKEMDRYLALMEREAPVPFREVAHHYRRKFKLIRWLALRFYLAFSLGSWT